MSPEPRVSDPYTTLTCPTTARLKSSLPKLGYPCSRAKLPQPVCPKPSLEPKLLPPSPSVSMCPSSVPLYAVTAPEEQPLILCSNNGVPPTPNHLHIVRGRSALRDQYIIIFFCVLFLKDSLFLISSWKTGMSRAAHSSKD